jgi:hypothetical protein
MLSCDRPWIVLSAFRDEAAILRDFLDELRLVLGHEGLGSVQLVLVNDLSFDDSCSVIAAWAQQCPELKVEVMSPPTNLGTQAALAWGLAQLHLKSPKSQWVFSMDCDGEDDLSMLPEMMRQAEQAPESIVYSVRTTRKDALRMRLLYFPFRYFYKHMTGQAILPNNFMVLPGRYQGIVLHSPFLPVYYALATLRLKTPWVASPSARRCRYGGHTTQNLFNLITHALVGLMIFHETVMARIYSYIALAFFLLLSTNVFALFVKFFQQKPVPDGYVSTFMTMNFGFGAVLLSVLGFTAGTSMMLKLATYYLIRWNVVVEQLRGNERA